MGQIDRTTIIPLLIETSQGERYNLRHPRMPLNMGSWKKSSIPTAAMATIRSTAG